MTDAEADRVIAKLRSGASYGYESYVAGIRETLERHGDGFRKIEQSLDDEDRVATFTEAQLRERLRAGSYDYLIAWADEPRGG